MKKGLLISVLFLLIAIPGSAQNKKADRNILIGADAPAFVAMSTEGEINFPQDFGPSWKILIAQPKAFTPVSSSEILELAHHQKSFEKLNAKLLILVTDVDDQNRNWKMVLEEVNFKERGPVKINFPFIDDSGYMVSCLYGLICSEKSLIARGVFIINPGNKVMYASYYPVEVGNNIDELHRTLIAMQTAYNDRSIVIPANWEPGSDVMVPIVTSLDRENMKNHGSDLYQLSWCMTYKKEK